MPRIHGNAPARGPCLPQLADALAWQRRPYVNRQAQPQPPHGLTVILGLAATLAGLGPHTGGPMLDHHRSGYLITMLPTRPAPPFVSDVAFHTQFFGRPAGGMLIAHHQNIPGLSALAKPGRL